MSVLKKWSCEYCTYENWPSATKCTLCRGPKPPQLIAEAASRQQDLDIYKLSTLICPDNSNVNQNSDKNTVDSINVGNKWSCQMCTYLNWPRATKCTQCLTPQKKISPTSSTSNDQLLQINVNELDIPLSHSESCKTSPTSPEASKDINNDKNKVWIKSVKWPCAACTYENWPKASKCVLCLTPRGRCYQEIASGSGLNSQDEEDNLRNNGNSKWHVQNVAALSENVDIQNVASIDGATASGNNYQEERRLKQIKNRLRETDWLWLNACVGVVDGDPNPVETYLASGGDPARQMSQGEVKLLNRPSAFDTGHTLVHLAIRFQREDLLAILLTSADVTGHAVKRVPNHVSPDLSADIRHQIVASLRQRKGDFPCYFMTELTTFALPAEIEDFSSSVQEQLFNELLDREVQKELEIESIINWSLELTDRLGSRLYALWNRTAGDCLLDSALQATWGVFDRDNILRRSLSDSLSEGATTFYPRWKECEAIQAQTLHFTLDEQQCQQDWAIILSLASQPGSSLEQTHIFTLSHILRRPIIVYGVKYVKSFRGETIGFARFEGVYLPLLWEQSFCWKTPIALAYTRGHFSALVPMEPDTDDNLGAGANIGSNDDLLVTFLPLMDSEGKLLPVHFLTASELGREESILREWLDCCITEGGILVAQQKLQKQPPVVAQMMEEWLDRYRRLAHITPSNHSQDFSSDEDLDDE